MWRLILEFSNVAGGITEGTVKTPLTGDLNQRSKMLRGDFCIGYMNLAIFRVFILKLICDLYGVISFTIRDFFVESKCVSEL